MRAVKGNHPVIVNVSRFLRTMVVSAVFVVAACALGTRQAIVYHTFDYPSPPPYPRSVRPDTLMVYRFLVAESVDLYALAISESKGKQKSLTFHRWGDNPADMITELVLRDISNSGLFGKTVDQLSTARYRYALEGAISLLEGVIRDGKASARLEAEITLTDFNPPPGAKKEVLKKRYAIEKPSESTSPDAIVRALNLAVEELSERIRGDIRAAFTAATSGKP